MAERQLRGALAPKRGAPLPLKAAGAGAGGLALDTLGQREER